ncbi:hypothetical protein L6452_07985 [Arctium lappa]|uniref:Uncharacterized protein n=1 Tax=Arctium lappa TaxID=4217 RepID=A0ACB9DGM3_ARCLA|nr:hypothetical protein L6452_07985 [Arctium lappa]
MAKLLSNLKKIRILYCDIIEEVVSNRDDEDEGRVASTNTSTGLLSKLDYLDLRHLPNFKRIGDGGASNEASFNIITPIHDQFEGLEF